MFPKLLNYLVAFTLYSLAFQPFFHILNSPSKIKIPVVIRTVFKRSLFICLTGKNHCWDVETLHEVMITLNNAYRQISGRWFVTVCGLNGNDLWSYPTGR